MNIEEFRELLADRDCRPKGKSARCPAHDDKDPSFSFNEGTDGIVVTCHAGCTVDAICEALGIRVADLFYESTRSKGERPYIVDTYRYYDENGELLYEVVRKSDKSFPQRRPDGHGDWIWKLDGVRRVIYRLPQVREAIAEGRPIWVAEGEKDVAALERQCQVATCNPMGASKVGETSKWRPEYSEMLAGARSVTIVADNDEPGLAHALSVAASLDGKVETVRIVRAAEGKDAFDHLERGHGLDDFVEIDQSVRRVIQCSLSEVIETFRASYWLPDPLPLLAALGTIAANLLPGDPVWLMLVGPPGSGKTEILGACSHIADVHEVATITEAALLSGVPRKEHAKGASGGLLREIGDFGLIVCKDFTSMLSQQRDDQAKTLSALREIYDGSWVRRFGTDGGKVLQWEGKVGLVAGCTETIDRHHGVVSSMGQRFVMVRLPDAGGEQLARARLAQGSNQAEIRARVADAVAGLFANRKTEHRQLADEETDRLIALAMFAVRARSSVERDYQGEIELVPSSEVPTRLVAQLERLLVGLDAIGCSRDDAWRVVQAAALDSIPQRRRMAFDVLLASDVPVSTSDVSVAVSHPPRTTLRALEDLNAHGIVDRKGGSGKPYLWVPTDWARSTWTKGTVSENHHPSDRSVPSSLTSPISLDDEYLARSTRGSGDAVDRLTDQLGATVVGAP